MKSPLFNICTQINFAAAHGLDLIAIAMAVALPDICVSLISDDGRTYPPRYKQWCRDNLKTAFDFLTPDDLYSMRCGVLHNGRYGDLKHSVGRVVFVPAGTGITFVNCMMNDAYFYSTLEFCNNMNQAVVDWYEANADHPNVKANIDRLMQYHHDGLAPYINGHSVVA